LRPYKAKKSVSEFASSIKSKYPKFHFFCLKLLFYNGVQLLVYET